LSKPPPPLLGFNNNVKHRGLVFHIQTEDSGIKRARIVTHLFADGGRIVRTSRTDYAEHVGREGMTEILRRLMKEQHKAMFIRLRSGELDEELQDLWGGQATTSAPDAAPPPKSDAEAVPPEPKQPPVRRPGPPPPPDRSARRSRPEADDRRLSNPGLRRVRPSMAPPGGELELDVSSLDQHPPGFGMDDPQRAAALARPRSRSESKGPPADGAGRPGSATRSDPPGRYAQSRPAAIFGDLPDPRGSIFGDNQVSEQSLDDVILSYLAEDLEEGSSDR